MLTPNERISCRLHGHCTSSRWRRVAAGCPAAASLPHASCTHFGPLGRPHCAKETTPPPSKAESPPATPTVTSGMAGPRGHAWQSKTYRNRLEEIRRGGLATTTPPLHPSQTTHDVFLEPRALPPASLFCAASGAAMWGGVQPRVLLHALPTWGSQVGVSRWALRQELRPQPTGLPEP